MEEVKKLDIKIELQRKELLLLKKEVKLLRKEAALMRLEAKRKRLVAAEEEDEDSDSSSGDDQELPRSPELKEGKICVAIEQKESSNAEERGVKNEEVSTFRHEQAKDSAIQQEQKSTSFAGKKQLQKWYVVYNGPNPGIYASWPEASKAISGISGLIHKSFTNRIDAEGSLANYRMPKLTFAQKVVQPVQPKNKFTFIGNISKPTKVTIEGIKEELRTISPEKFFELYNKARKHSGESMEEDCFFTTDVMNTSKYNLLEGSDPKFAYQLFQCGLIENVYPSSNLMELQYFPENFKKAIRNFRRRVKATDRPVYLNFTSSLVDWTDLGEVLTPYHFIKLGLASPNREVKTPQVLEEKVFSIESLYDERARSLLKIYKELKKINTRRDMRVNYATTRILMVSHSSQPLPEEDAVKVGHLEARFISGQLDVGKKTSEYFCFLCKKDSNHVSLCVNCGKCKEPVTSEEDGYIGPYED
uniref:Transactivator/viroplasmin protein n=1 Tax=Grapevine-associated caulimovirus TaxID=2768782 RepID=A0A7S6NH20_9VIRU|nr:ORF6 protein [Grapevine-associated caulimovirus]